ncbi:restriction endonuclease subunit S [Nodosilinea nodulosa]|uniref:restriction endonuclease subunit S n=1 Tax=Nodosilinea nodulosa TaxID=416001 RepID=UPI0002EF4E57|nr:restriction endonuclease subunit S [Nodosilinea nodulosa]
MKLTKVKLAEITLINPTLSDKLADENQQVAFVPMASVQADPPQVQVAESRTLSSVKSGFSYFQDGDILVAKITPCFENGKIAQARIEYQHGFGSTEFHVVRPKSDQLDGQYLLHFLRQNHIRRQGERRMTGSAGQRRVPKVFLESLEIYLPPIAEQRRIAAILNKAEELRELRRQALRELDAIAQSIFIEMFGDPINNPKEWTRSRLGEHLNLIGGFAFESKDFTATGIPLIRIGTINQGSFKGSDLVYLPKSFCKKYEKFLVFPGDILITLTGTIGKNDYGNIFILGNQHEKYFLNQRVAKISLNSDAFNPLYFLYVFKQMSVKGSLTKLSRGIRQANISNDDILNLAIPLPPTPIQQEFARRIESIEQLKAIHCQSLPHLDVLFTSLQHRAFRGEL